MSVTPDAPETLLANHPETAYFWGNAVGTGEMRSGQLSIESDDSVAARRLATIAGDVQVDHRIAEREYLHNTSVTRTAETYTVRLSGDLPDRAADAFDLPIEEATGGYRFDAFAGNERQLLRGLVESCATICFKSSAGTVGVSFVHEDRQLLARIRTLLDGISIDAPSGELSAASSGHWFGVRDEAVPVVGPWLYEGCETSGLFNPSRRRKLRRSLERADVESEW